MNTSRSFAPHATGHLVMTVSLWKKTLTGQAVLTFMSLKLPWSRYHMHKTSDFETRSVRGMTCNLFLFPAQCYLTHSPISSLLSS